MFSAFRALGLTVLDKLFVAADEDNHYVEGRHCPTKRNLNSA
jgi:hypothetical protein